MTEVSFETKPGRIITIGGMYIFCSLIANIMALKLVNVWGWIFPSALILYPLTFTIRDLYHKETGARKSAVGLILFTALLNILMSAMFWISYLLPGVPGTGEAMQYLTWTPVIVFASITAMIVSELTDTQVYHLWWKKWKSKYQFGRVLASNFISTPLDSVIFITIAYGLTMPMEIIISAITGQIIVKYLLSLITAPTIYMIHKDEDNP